MPRQVNTHQVQVLGEELPKQKGVVIPMGRQICIHGDEKDPMNNKSQS